MSDVKFFAMRMDFQIVRDNYGDANFAKFVFQQIMLDSGKNRDEFTLMGYAVDIYDEVSARFDLETDKANLFIPIKRLEIGNIPFSRKAVEKFIEADKINKIDALFFEPYDYGDYVGYKVVSEPIYMGRFVEQPLNPCPPAKPGDQ